MMSTLEEDRTIMMRTMLAVVDILAVIGIMAGTAIKGEVLMEDYRGRKVLHDLEAIKKAEGGHGVIMVGMR